jgi:hypothetical protein
MIRIAELEQTFKDIFDEEGGLVQSIETTYEKSLSGDFYKLVISIHGLSIGDTLIIHTKFIFKTDLEKRKLLDNSFIYLYDINCNYRKVDFNNVVDMKNKIYSLYKTLGLISILPILVYFILLIPSVVIFFFTWLLAPIQPESFTELELIGN